MPKNGPSQVSASSSPGDEMSSRLQDLKRRVAFEDTYKTIVTELKWGRFRPSARIGTATLKLLQGESVSPLPSARNPQEQQLLDLAQSMQRKEFVPDKSLAAFPLLDTLIRNLHSELMIRKESQIVPVEVEDDTRHLKEKLRPRKK